MSRISRKVNSRPVHSPSPDLAHRNIIAKTEAPIDEVLRKSRLGATGPEPLGSSFPSVEELQRALSDMHEKYNALYKQYLQLVEHNRQLQNAKDASANHPSARSAVQGHAQRQAEEQHLLEVYEKKTGDLLEEMKRIQKKLKESEEEKKQLEKENEGLRWESNMKSGRQTLDRYPERQVGLSTAEIQRGLNQEVARLSYDLEQKVNQYLRGLNQRVNEVENSTLSLSRLQQNKELATPQTHRKSGRMNQSSRTPQNKKFSRKSPSVEEFDREHQNMNRQILAQQEEINALKRQNNSLKKLLDNGKKSSQNLTRDESKFECPSCRKLQRKVSQLQQLLRVKKASYEQLERDQQQIRLQLERKTIALENCAANSILVRNGLTEVRNQLQSKEIDNLLEQNELIHSEIYGVDSKFKDLHDQYERIYHQKQVQLSLALMDAKKEAELLKVEVREQAEQIGKLQEIIGQKLRDAPQIRKDQSHSRIDLSDQNKRFRELLNQAISKIENLEEKIQTTLEQ